jgi:hypothetical protein
LALLLAGWEAWGAVVLFPRQVQADELTINSEYHYEVIVQVSQSEVRSVKPVKLLEVRKFGSMEFLVIEPMNLPQKTQGYVALEAIRAILPIRPGGIPILDH